MKNLKVTLAAMMIALFTVFGANKAQAQTNNDAVNNVVAGLLAVAANVQVGDVAILSGNTITIGDITITDVVDVTTVLNNVEINILRDFLNNNTVTVDNVLNDILRDAKILNNTTIVVGLLSNLDGTFTLVTQTVTRARGKK